MCFIATRLVPPGEVKSKCTVSVSQLMKRAKSEKSGLERRGDREEDEVRRGEDRWMDGVMEVRRRNNFRPLIQRRTQNKGGIMGKPRRSEM